MYLNLPVLVEHCADLCKYIYTLTLIVTTISFINSDFNGDLTYCRRNSLKV